MNISLDEILQNYGLDTAFPQQWKDSGYSTVLATLGTDLTSAQDNSTALVDELLGALTTNQTVATDEQDPLGSGHSILEILQHRSKNVPKSASDRSALLPSSTNFDPRRFLREVHGTASLADLERGLSHLRNSMAGNEHGLRQMVDTDYESFVTSKRRLDDVMGQLSHIGVNQTSEYGMKQLQQRLVESTNQLTVRARPLDGVTAERQRLENALRGLETHRNIMELPETLEKHVKNGDHDQFLRDYKRGVRMLRPMIDESANPLQQKIGSMVADQAQKVLNKYRNHIKTQLMKTPADGSYAPLLGKLMELGVSGNPALEWLEHNVKRFATDIDETFNLLTTTATRNLADTLESGRKLDLTTYLRNLTSAVSSGARRGGAVSMVNNTTMERTATSVSAASQTANNPLANGPAATALPSIDEIAEFLDMSDIAIDTEGAVQQWKQILTLFETLRHTLHKSSVFYHEFVALSSGSTASSGNLKLSSAEVASITKHCQDLVSMTGHQIVQCLTAPVPKSLALPIAAAHARDADNHELSDSSDHLTFLPLNSNSLAVAKYLGRILKVLSLMAAQVSELVPMDSANPLAESVSVVKQQFVKTLCECWTRDSMQLGKVQDWSGAGSSSKFPEYFSTYHGLMIEKLRYLLDSSRGGPASAALVSHIEKVFPAALSLSIRSVEAALVESSRISMSDAQSAIIKAQLQPASLGQDAKLLITLNNLETLRKVSLEQVYDQFETVFKQQHHTRLVRQEVTPEVDKISAQLFDIYIRKKRSRLSQVVHQETQRLIPKWRDDDNGSEPREVRRVSNYIYECLMILVETHYLCLESCPQMTRRAVLELYRNLLSTILSVLRDLDSLSRYGTLQNITDLEFMRWALSQFPETTDTCQLIFDAIRRASADNEIWEHADGPRSLVLGVLDEAVRHSHFAFFSFKSFTKPGN